MKHYLTLLSLLVTLNFYAQNYEFGKVSKEELEAQASAIDENADAEILYKNESIFYTYTPEDGFIQRRRLHLRIKIYNKEGLDWANHSARLYNGNSSSRTKIYGEKGYTYNLENGSIKKVKLKKDGIFEEEVNKYWKKVSFTLPNVKEGSVIELKYELETPFIEIEDTYLQALIPIRKLDLELKIPQYFTFKKVINPRGSFYPEIITSTKKRTESFVNKGDYTSRKAQGYSKSELAFTENISAVHLDNVPALRQENYIDNLDNYVAKIVWEYSYFRGPNGQVKDYTSNWDKVAKTIYKSDYFGGQLKKTGYFEDELNVLLSDIEEPMAKASAIFQFVKSKVKWNDYLGKYTNDGVKKAYKEGSGNVAEINLMLTAMLRYADFNANPVLVSTKSNGIPITPTLNGFNYVISAIELNNKVILLDATNLQGLPNILPKRAINWQGRIVREDESSTWISLQQTKPVLDSKSVNYKINPDLTVTGKIREHSTLQLAQNKRNRELKLSLDKKIERLEDRDFDITVENLEYANEAEIAKPYIKKYDFQADELIEEIGDKLYVSPLLFYTMEESPFKEETRQYPIDFVYPFIDKYMVNIQIPEGYAVESLPENLSSKLSEDDISSFKYIAKQNGSYIQLVISFNFKYSFVPADQYEGFKQYFNSYVDKMSEKIVLKKL